MTQTCSLSEVREAGGQRLLYGRLAASTDQRGNASPQ